MFNPVNQKQNLPELEAETLKFWEKNKIFEKSVNQRVQKKKYVFFDGPPFANGLPHYGHILANVLKDAVVRYFVMKGYYVPRVNGWDCHGLPVEYEIEKELEISGRKQIESYGVEKFNDKCRESVFRYTDEWEKTLKRIARWVDFGHSYATLNTPYMESIWWVFKQIWDKGMVYQGYKSMHICPRCETPLSNFEVTQGYKEIVDLSITVKFFLEEESANKLIKKFGLKTDAKIAVLAWTTTPWTLPGNTALAVGPKIAYAVVETGNGGEFYIVAKNLVDRIFAEQKFVVIGDLKAKDLEELRYEPLFDFYKNAYPNGWRVVLGDFVATEEGTGIVHCAPAFGEEDYLLSQEKDLPVIQHLGIDGNFKKETREFAGKFAKALDLPITDDLNKRGLLFKKENVRHSYPHCWRCDTPLLNYATRSWFIRVTDIKRDLIKNNKKIHWQPEHIGPGRFGKWLEEARDWAISRNRYWGCPIPIWECKCGEKICIGSIEELKKYSGGAVPMRQNEVNLHIPYIDEIKFKCLKCGGAMKRISEVLDCWFESGAMPYAQLHYPFENKREFEANFPADFIAEGLDQTRGWFYTLHILSTILFNSPAFKNVIVNGILLAEDGEKLSKRKKNYPDPNMIFETKGVDALRFFLLSSTAVLAEDVRFSEKHVDEILKQFLLTIWNAYSFFVMYANIDKFSPKKLKTSIKPKNLLDRWILSELNTLIQKVTSAMDDYNLADAARPMFSFVDNLSNWYIRRSRRRFWKSENDSDKTEAYETLYTVLIALSKLVAPFTPFIADEIYKNLTNSVVGAYESVHLEDWPKANKKLIDSSLNEEMRITRIIVNLGLSARSRARIKVRQPLRKIEVALPSSIDPKLVKMYEDIILEELNVKNLEFISKVGEDVKQIVTINPRVIGPKYGTETQKIINACKEGKFEIVGGNKVKILDYVLEEGEFTLGYAGSGEINIESQDGIIVILDSHIDSDLLFEGYGREIVRFIQEMRKKAEYNVSDRIYIFVESSDREISEAVTAFADYIKRETLAIELQDKGDFEWDLEEIAEIEGKKVKIGVRK